MSCCTSKLTLVIEISIMNVIFPQVDVCQSSDKDTLVLESRRGGTRSSLFPQTNNLRAAALATVQGALSPPILLPPHFLKPEASASISGMSGHH